MLKLKEITKENFFPKNWSHYVRGFRPTKEPTKEAAYVYCQISIFYLLPKRILKNKNNYLAPKMLMKRLL
jgi:hypothetical protein